MFHSEKPSLKRKSFLNEVTAALDVYMANIWVIWIQNL